MQELNSCHNVLLNTDIPTMADLQKLPYLSTVQTLDAV